MTAGGALPSQRLTVLQDQGMLVIPVEMGAELCDELEPKHLVPVCQFTSPSAQLGRSYFCQHLNDVKRKEMYCSLEELW